MEKGEVNKAFEIILDDVRSEIDALNKSGSSAFQDGDYERAEALMEKGKKLIAVLEKVANIRKDWEDLTDSRMSQEPTKQTPVSTTMKKASRKTYKRQQKGKLTHEDEYRIPILTALVKLGGSGHIQKVTDLVGEYMKPIFNEHDYKPLKSDSSQPTWRNRAAWVRYHLVQEGYMKSGSPTGTWELSDKGKDLLQKHGQ